MKHSNSLKPLSQYRLVLFDLDGTLYYQLPLRMLMALSLGFYYLFHLRKIKELLILKKYREIREAASGDAPENALVHYQQAGEPFQLDAEQTQKIVQHWMYDVPCHLLKLVKDKKLSRLIDILQTGNIMTAVYSDYSVEEKLEALELRFPHCYCSFDPKIQCLKPNPNGLNHILKEHGVKPGDALMVGDRMSKDGEAARGAGTDYYILSPNPLIRRKQIAALSKTI